MLNAPVEFIGARFCKGVFENLASVCKLTESRMAGGSVSVSAIHWHSLHHENGQTRQNSIIEASKATIFKVVIRSTRSAMADEIRR